MSPLIDEPINDGRQVGDTVAWNRCRPHRAVAFNGNQHSLFAGASAAFVNNLFLIARFAANVFFVQFDNAGQSRGGRSWRVIIAGCGRRYG
jgi:hypothetical protein